MSLREYISEEVSRLDDRNLEQLAHYLSSLRFKSVRPAPKIHDEEERCKLYAEFAEEDRAIAEEGIEEFARLLHEEDIYCH